MASASEGTGFSSFIRAKVATLSRKAGTLRNMKAYLHPRLEAIVTVMGNARVLPMLAPDSLNPIALPCLDPNLSESRALATGRWTPWKRPTRNLRMKMSVNPLAPETRNVAAPYPTMLTARTFRAPNLLLRAPAGILMTM